jgi:hypothetical protein
MSMRYVKENNTFNLTIHEVRAICEHASDDQTRLHLSSVMLGKDKKTGRACVVATDGHRLARVRNCSDFEGADRLVNADDLKQAATGAVSVDVNLGDSGACVVSYPRAGKPRVSSLAYIDASFPPFEQVIPTFDPKRKAVAVGFNAGYLSALSLIAKACETRTGAVKCEMGDELDPAVFTAEKPGESDWTVFIMPMRI